MIKINQLKLPVGHSQKDLEDKIRKTLRIPSKETFHYEVMRRSLDARKKPSLFYVYCIYVTIRQENSIVKKLHQPSVSLVTETGYRFSEMGHERLNRRPVIVGAGPCGLFAAWQLTLAGYAPLILERGKQVEDRSADVERFWKTGILQPDSNVQFGEGGAGTFSDGKLNTVVKDPSGRNRCTGNICKIWGTIGHSLRCKTTYRNRYSGEGDQKYEGLPDQTRRGVSFSDLFKRHSDKRKCTACTCDGG